MADSANQEARERYTYTDAYRGRVQDTPKAWMEIVDLLTEIRDLLWKINSKMYDEKE